MLSHISSNSISLVPQVQPGLYPILTSTLTYSTEFLKGICSPTRHLWILHCDQRGAVFDPIFLHLRLFGLPSKLIRTGFHLLICIRQKNTGGYVEYFNVCTSFFSWKSTVFHLRFLLLAFAFLIYRFDPLLANRRSSTPGLNVCVFNLGS